MKLNYSRPTIQAGRQAQRLTEEVSEFVPLIDGAPQRRPNRELSVQNQRMAGRVGARALAMMTNPEEIKRTDNFMRQLRSSPLRSVQETLGPPPMVG